MTTMVQVEVKKVFAIVWFFNLFLFFIFMRFETVLLTKLGVMRVVHTTKANIYIYS